MMTNRQVFWRLLGYLRAYLWVLPLMVLGFALTAGTEVLIAKMLQFITDAINQNNRHHQVLFPFFVIGLFVLRGLGAFLGGYYSALAGRHLVYELRIRLFEKLLRLPASFYLSHPVGVLSSKLIFDVEQVTQASTLAITTLIKDGLTVIFLFGYLLYANWRLTLVLFLVLPPVLVVVRLAARKFLSLSKDIQDSMGDINHITHEVITGADVVKNYAGQGYELARFEQASRSNLDKGLRMIVLATLNTPLVQLFMATGMCLVVWIALSPNILGAMSAGQFISYLTAVGLLSKPSRALTDVNVKLQQGISGARSIFDILDLKNETDTGCTTTTGRGDVTLEGVSLRYPDGTLALDDIHLTIKEGQTVALVGKSGAGKSTLAGLITRTHVPTCGTVCLDGVELRDISLDSLRAVIALVSQKVVLFNGTVRQNIAYGALADAPIEAIEQAARQAYAHEFIKALPKGYDTPIGADGSMLSGGQRQRLILARALLKDAPILILDEATSALDNESEYYIQQALDTVMHNRTTLVIAHRLSTIERADEILVMDKGRILERGDHKSLMARRGAYFAMHAREFVDV